MGTRHTPRRAASAARGDGGGGDAAEPLGCHPPMDKERLSCGVSVVATGLQRHGEGARLFNDFDRSANRKTELAVSAPLIDGDFGKPVRILVPEGRARRLIAEGPRAL